MEVGHRDEELERMPGRHQRLHLAGLRPTRIHVAQGVVHPNRDRVASQHGFLHGAGEQERHFEQRRHPGRPTQQHFDVAALEPEVAQRVLRAVVCDRLREVDAVDATGRGAGDDIDDDTRPDTLRVTGGQLREQVAIDLLGRRRPGESLICERRRFHKTLELLRRAVHVDRERCTAVEDDAESQLTYS